MRRFAFIFLIFSVVVALSACGSSESAVDSTQDGTGSGSSATTAAVTVAAHDIYYEVNGVQSNTDDLTINAGAGDVNFTLDNQGAAVHNLVVEEAGNTLVAEAAGGATADGSITLTAGTYTVYCNIPGHREAGMELTLAVSG